MKVLSDGHLRGPIRVREAAAMYGIGARLDRSPEDLFRLRRLDPDPSAVHAVEAAGQAAEREALDAADLPAISGVSVEPESGPAHPGRRRPRTR